MSWWNRSNLSPIGIDIGHDSLRMLQFAQSPTGLTVHSATRRPLEASTSNAARAAAAADLVRRLLKQEGFSGRSAVLALPDEILQIRTVRIAAGAELPTSDPASIPEVRRAFDFDLAEASPRILEAGEIRQGSSRLRELIVVAALNSEVEAWLTEWRKAGIRVESLEVRPCALYRTLCRFETDPNAVRALLELGGDKSRVLIAKGPTICFLKSVPIGCDQINQAVARKLSITTSDAAQLRQRLVNSSVEHVSERNDPVRQAVYDAMRGTLEELVEAVSRCVRYHAITFRGPRPSKLSVFGADACDAQVRLALTTALTGITVETPDPLAGIDVLAMKPADHTNGPGQWAGAVGLALKRLRSSTAYMPIPAPLEPAAPRAEPTDVVGTSSLPDATVNVVSTEGAMSSGH